MNIRALVEMAVLAFLVLSFGHYAMPRVMGRDPRRLEAYVLGIFFGLWVPVAVVTWWEGLGWDHLLVVVVASVGAGAGTALAWTLDKANGKGGLPGLWEELAGILRESLGRGEQTSVRH